MAHSWRLGPSLGRPSLQLNSFKVLLGCSMGVGAGAGTTEGTLNDTDTADTDTMAVSNECHQVLNMSGLIQE